MSGSESESSDMDSSSEKSMYSKVRLEALQCLHELVLRDARRLHASWLGILPVYAMQAASLKDVTLIDVVLRDPVPKVRAPIPHHPES